MKRIVILSAALLLTGCATMTRDDWTARDTALEVAFQVVNAYDAHTTQRIHNTPGIVEQRHTLAHAVLGEQPDPTETAVYFATRGLIHYLVSRYLPPRLRPWWQPIQTVESAVAITGNCDVGLCD